MTADSNDNRRFLRHPSDIPIEVTEVSTPFEEKRTRLKDVSIAGLSFICNISPREGALIHIRIPIVEPVFEADGRVAWLTEEEGGHRVGVEFLGNNDAFRIRMVEQLSYIEHYRRELSRERGEEVSSEEAARDWIKKFAADFPPL